MNAQNQTLDAINRRSFIQAAGGCSALSSGAILSTLLNLKASNAAAAMQPNNLDGYKAMVCIFLFGGNDSFNMLVPREDDEYADYAAIRGSGDASLALAKDDLLPISAVNGRKFGLHPSMGELKSLYDDNKCAMVANVGTLVRPTTMADYLAKRDLPEGLFSHSDHIRHWQTSIPQSRSRLTGWGGRMADLVTDATNDNEAISMNISLSGVAQFETGRNVIPYVIQPNGASTLAAHSGTARKGRDAVYRRMTDIALNRSYTDLLQKTYAQTNRNSIDAAAAFNDAVAPITLNTAFPTSSLGSQLKMIARTIGARSTLSQRRQIFFVTVGGWDHHDEVLNNQKTMLEDVSKSVKAFYDATVELNVANDVVAYTVSDFGRSLTSNGNGSDHAWGGNQFVVGGSVNGGDVFGDYPSSLLSDRNTDLDVGRGRVIPTMSVDEHAAELALWYGIANDNNLEAVLPNVRNFYSAGASGNPVGFMKT